MQFSYIILEATKREVLEYEYKRIIDLLYQYKDGAVEHDFYQENSSKTLFLVIKLDKLAPDDFVMKVFRNMPNDCSAYFYFRTQKDA